MLTGAQDRGWIPYVNRGPGFSRTGGGSNMWAQDRGWIQYVNRGPGQGVDPNGVIRDSELCLDFQAFESPPVISSKDTIQIYT